MDDIKEKAEKIKEGVKATLLGVEKELQTSDFALQRWLWTPLEGRRRNGFPRNDVLSVVGRARLSHHRCETPLHDAHTTSVVGPPRIELEGFEAVLLSPNPFAVH